ncbi:MAG: class I SAM-dependent methyltransferase [Endozoicomonadaceae bacterium]|nr:class I SAM-dependent methyltransferase [Endozoicomonadaceae bacterium]
MTINSDKKIYYCITQIRIIARSVVLWLISLPLMMNVRVMRMELITWALCRKHKRYQKGNLFFHKQGILDTCCYGETPLITLERIAMHAKIDYGSSLLDMGSGAGKAAAYFTIKKSCRVLGVEKNPEMLSLANRMARGCRINDRLRFIDADMFTLPVQDVDFIYIYHSALDDISIEKIAKQLSRYDPKVKIITVSWALQEVLPGFFTIETQFDGWFPWGLTWVYVQRPVVAYPS